jgi:CrcB protein
VRLAFTVGVLGGLGSLCRWWLSMAIQRRVATVLSVARPITGGPRGLAGFPGSSPGTPSSRWLSVAGSLPVWTFVVNVLGSIAIGAVMGFFLARAAGAGGASSKTAVALTAGFLGGFTTYSSFAFETVRLIEQRSFVAAALNVGATVVVCLLGCALGLLVGRAAGR